VLPVGAVVSGEGGGTGDGSGAAGGVIRGGGDGADSGEGEGAASGTDGEAGTRLGGAGVQPAASSNSRQKIIPMYFIIVPSVQDISIRILVTV